MDRLLLPMSAVSGDVVAPGSKSFAQRALLAAALAGGESTLGGFSPCGDCSAVTELLRGAGCELSFMGTNLSVDSTCFKCFGNQICTGESALLTRLVGTLVALGDGQTTISGEGSLLRRDMSELIEMLRLLGCEVVSHFGRLPLTICGPIIPGVYKIDGSRSSQIISALLMTLPLCSSDSKILVENLVSKPYVEITLRLLAEFGIDVESVYSGYIIRGGQSYHPTNYQIEGDWSSAAPFLAMGAIGGEITVSNLNQNSPQADRFIVEVLLQAGATLQWRGDCCCVRSPESGVLSAFECDLTDCPDLFPVVAVLASRAVGISTLKGTSRLANKESDRVRSIARLLETLGAKVDCSRENIMLIEAGSESGDIIVDTYSDHRIAMAAAVATIKNTRHIIINDGECVRKSYPDFWSDYSSVVRP